MPSIFACWDDAARLSKSRLAVSEPKRVYHEGKWIMVELIVGFGGEAYATYAGGPIKVLRYRPLASEIDGCRRWHPYI